MQFEGIVKNRLKIKSTITNAKLFLAVQKEFGSFYNYTLSFFPDKKPIINTFRSLSEIPVSSPESDAMSKDMKKRGFKFFGTTICYAHLQASGFINDHLTDCICRKVRLSGNFWLVSFKISYLCLPLFYETRTTPSCHPSGCAYRQL